MFLLLLLALTLLLLALLLLTLLTLFLLTLALLSILMQTRNPPQIIHESCTIRRHHKYITDLTLIVCAAEIGEGYVLRGISVCGGVFAGMLKWVVLIQV